MENSLNIPGVIPEKKNRTYWSIFNGALCTKVKDGTPGSRKRINKMNIEVSEVYVNGIEGVLLSVKYTEHDSFGKQIEVCLENSGHQHVLCMSQKSSYHQMFVERLPNVKIHLPLKIQVYKTNYKGKDFSGISLEQDGSKIENAFVRKNGNDYVYSNGYPPFPKNFKIMSKREQSNYFFDRDEFLENVVTQFNQKTFSSNKINEDSFLDETQDDFLDL